jgi:hypothetical protein
MPGVGRTGWVPAAAISIALPGRALPEGGGCLWGGKAGRPHDECLISGACAVWEAQRLHSIKACITHVQLAALHWLLGARRMWCGYVRATFGCWAPWWLGAIIGGMGWFGCDGHHATRWEGAGSFNDRFSPSNEYTGIGQAGPRYCYSAALSHLGTVLPCTSSRAHTTARKGCVQRGREGVQLSGAEYRDMTFTA